MLRCRLGPRHRTRASGQCAKCVECFGTAKLRQCWPMPADPPASTNGPTATATERGRALARRPAPPESRIGYLGGVSWEVLVTPLAGRSEISAFVGLMTAPSLRRWRASCCAPFGSQQKAPGNSINRCARADGPFFGLCVPRAVPLSGHCTRLQGHCLGEFCTVRLRPTVACLRGNPIFRCPETRHRDQRRGVQRGSGSQSAMPQLRRACSFQVEPKRPWVVVRA